jgi:cutinase
MMNAISKLPEDLKAKVLGVVLFGYTKNGQQKGGIPNYPKDKVKVFCSASDGVCDGKLNVTAGHFSYMGDGSGPKAVEFLMNAINGAGKGAESSAPAAQSSGEASSEAPAPAPAAAAASPKGARSGRPKGSKGAGGSA